MADKDDNDLHSSSLSGHDSDDNSDNGKNDSNIPSIPPPESPANGEDNSAAIEKFLEQVVAANNADAKANGEASKGKDREKELKFAKRLVIPPECKCQLNNGEPCHTRFSVRELMDTRSHYMSISKKELDIAVLAKLECGIHLTKMTTRKKRRPTERKKHRTDFYHHGYRICNLMFVYLHGFSYKKLKALIMQYKTNGVKTRIHKNLKPKPPEAEVKVKKKKHKPKPKPKEPTLPKPKKQRVTKSKQGKTAGSGRGAKKDIQITQQHHHSILPKPPQALPHPPLHPPHPHPYSVGFPMSNQTNPAQATAFMSNQHNPQAPFPHAVGYNNSAMFPPRPMSGHHPHHHPHHPGVSGQTNPPLDFSNQRPLVNPPLDFSNQRTNPSNMQGFQGTNRPGVAYSVVHSMPF
ncbi:uncharacterized protein [Littorina saxatilis]|uniref:Uncharacterized protein n=1 Tax=Littorina saxatilis TaxID=31220 RepID=A0AAN9B638_9CAEN